VHKATEPNLPTMPVQTVRSERTGDSVHFGLFPFSSFLSLCKRLKLNAVIR